MKKERWDVVVIEPSRRINPYESSIWEAELDAAKTLNRLAQSAGAELLLYAVWGNNHGTVVEYRAITPTNTVTVASHEMGRREHTAFMQAVNRSFAEELGGVRIAEAGEAFEMAIVQHPDIVLYHADNRHPSPSGTYLAACVIYGVLFGERVAEMSKNGDEEKQKLQAIANEIVFGRA